MSQELCSDVEMGLFEPAVLAAGINQLFKLSQKRPRGQPLSLCLGCVPPSPVGAIALARGAATLAPMQSDIQACPAWQARDREVLSRGT